jgi:hypothetical protein
MVSTGQSVAGGQVSAPAPVQCGATTSPASQTWCEGKCRPLRAAAPAPRVFASGASRDTDVGKLDFEGFLSPAVLQAFAEHMQANRQMADGSTREADNWQKGLPRRETMKSMWRHFFAVWLKWRTAPDNTRDRRADLCALLFNVMAMLHEDIKEGANGK